MGVWGILLTRIRSWKLFFNYVRLTCFIAGLSRLSVDNFCGVRFITLLVWLKCKIIIIKYKFKAWGTFVGLRHSYCSQFSCYMLTAVYVCKKLSSLVLLEISSCIGFHVGHVSKKVFFLQLSGLKYSFKSHIQWQKNVFSLAIELFDHLGFFSNYAHNVLLSVSLIIILLAHIEMAWICWHFFASHLMICLRKISHYFVVYRLDFSNNIYERKNFIFHLQFLACQHFFHLKMW